MSNLKDFEGLSVSEVLTLLKKHENKLIRGEVIRDIVEKSGVTDYVDKLRLMAIYMDNFND